VPNRSNKREAEQVVQRTVLDVIEYREANGQSVEGAKGHGRACYARIKHGELKTSRGRKVKNPKQAIAIGLREAGASKYESKAKNRQNLKRTKAREGRGVTARDTSERSGGQEATRSQLYAEGKRRNIPGRSKMSKNELERALR
jgi:hypothetical protein